ncbi:SH3 domain-containing protein [Patescibacteria group bacterium]|nr:SH3 domain-containing protein [Patescibacteria group bacterium]MCG2702593.1 SH3 domain-containing protein [Candidatus Parcubacteria bacterium]MBU4265513.1 SH3 domain-containing protein [Patescibacteria group bacterium]MBU4390563.1 SH3 domain-containing protein [Patescibacteria group bacterium]MBU4396903.1 SH3 domain-containing protein [Patescibacteria group bacterium]
MKIKLKICLNLLFGIAFLLVFPNQTQATSVSVTGKAKVLNTGNSYLDFTNYNSNTTIDDTTGNFSGYAFCQDVGWVDFGSTDNPLGPVNLNLTSGAVTGKAYVINTAAYFDFTNYNSNVSVALATGVFSGYVFSEDAGWIDFSDTGVSSASPFLPTAPSGLSGSVDSSTAITWSWTDNSSNETGFRVDDSSNNDQSGNLATGVTSWQETGFSANTSYTRHVHAFNTAGDSVASSNATTVTLSSAPTSSNITSDRSTSTWYSTADFTFTNGISGGFGGEMEYFRYAWDTSSTHTWTGSETQWSTGTLTVTAGSDSNSWYLHLKGYNSADVENGTVDLGPYYYDGTAPASFNLDSPGHENYSNSERPSFKWKAAETPDAVSGLSKYKLEIDNGDSGDFTIDDIPVSRTTDYETSKYLIHYENFSDSDTTNNYISVYTKSSNDWSSDSNSGNNDGKLKEGKRYWKVKAVDNAGNEKEESRTLFVDRNGPSVEATQINDTSSADSLATTDKTPTIYGKTTDSLTGDGLKVASGPKEVEIKFEKRNYLGVYNLHTLATVNISELYWSSDGSKITDNSKQTSNKYSSFSYTPTTDLPLGVYRITLTGKDKASNGGSSSSFTLTIKTYEEIAQIPEVEEVIEELEKEGIPREKIEEVIKEQGIVIPEELQEPSVIAEAIGKIFTGIANLWWKTVDSAKFLAGKIGQGLAFVGNQIKNGVSAVAGAVGKTTNQFLASRKQKNEERKLFLARGYFNLTQKTSGVIRDGLLALANGAEVVNRTVGNTINKTTDGVKALASNVGEGVKTISQQTSRLATAWQTGRESIRKPASEEAQNLATRLRIATSTFIAIVFDNEPTKILFVKIEEVNSTSAMVVWGTNHYATSVVNYGLNTSYGKKIQSDKRVKEHRMELKDLEPGKLYYFEVMSQNKNYVYDAYYTFNTPEKEEGKVKGAVAGETLATITADEGSWVVVRSEPSLKGEVLAKVTDGQSFPSLEEKDGWVKIQLDPSTGSGQVEGWVFGELIEIGDEEQE